MPHFLPVRFEFSLLRSLRYKYNGTASKVTVPTSATIDGSSYQLRTIDAKAFSGNQHIQEVIISEGITSIGNYAFENCATLSSVTIASSVTKLSSGAFRNCTNLTAVTINGDLDDCSSYSTSTYDNRSANYSVFYNTGTNVDSFSVTLGSSVTRIPAYLFATAYAKSDSVYPHITSISIADSVKEIGNYAFYACYDLSLVSIGSGVTSIGERAFSYDISIAEITLPNKLTTIHEYAFLDCTSLQSITVPSSVTKLVSDK